MPDAEVGFTRYFVAGVLFRCALVGVLMLLGAAGVGVGRLVSGAWAPFLGGVAGIAVGVLVARPVKRRWDPLNRTPGDATAASPSPPDD